MKNWMLLFFVLINVLSFATVIERKTFSFEIPFDAIKANRHNENQFFNNDIRESAAFNLETDTVFGVSSRKLDKPMDIKKDEKELIRMSKNELENLRIYQTDIVKYKEMDALRILCKGTMFPAKAEALLFINNDRLYIMVIIVTNEHNYLKRRKKAWEILDSFKFKKSDKQELINDKNIVENSKTVENNEEKDKVEKLEEKQEENQIEKVEKKIDTEKDKTA